MAIVIAPFHTDCSVESSAVLVIYRQGWIPFQHPHGNL